nr:MAG TPA: hypothetical protein [Caudoviricetes sp.]
MRTIRNPHKRQPSPIPYSVVNLEEWLNHAGYRRCYICRHLIMTLSINSF